MEMVVEFLLAALAIVSVAAAIGWLAGHWSMEPRKPGRRRAF
jgi:hypothetical protein